MSDPWVKYMRSDRDDLRIDQARDAFRDRGIVISRRAVVSMLLDARMYARQWGDRSTGEVRHFVAGELDRHLFWDGDPNVPFIVLLQAGLIFETSSGWKVHGWDGMRRVSRNSQAPPQTPPEE